MICCVIANYHPMLGVDFHDSFPTFIGPLVPRGPHIVGAIVRFGPWWMAGSKETTKVVTPPGNVISKVFDIGMFIPHIPLVPDVYFWLYILVSSSQGHFGVASVQTDKGPIAAALMLFVNPQLQCEGPLTMPPAPTGVVLAPNTVVAGMTIGDVIAGFVTMVITSAVTFGLAHFLNFAVPALANGIMNSLIRVVSPRIMLPATLIGAVLVQRFPVATALGVNIVNTLIGWSVGSPMGYSFGFAPFGSLLTDGGPFGIPSIESVGNNVGSWVDNTFGSNDYFDNSVLLPPFPFSPLPGPVLVPVQ